MSKGKYRRSDKGVRASMRATLYDQVARESEAQKAERIRRGDARQERAARTDANTQGGAA